MKKKTFYRSMEQKEQMEQLAFARESVEASESELLSEATSMNSEMLLQYDEAPGLSQEVCQEIANDIMNKGVADESYYEPQETEDFVVPVVRKCNKKVNLPDEDLLEEDWIEEANQVSIEDFENEDSENIAWDGKYEEICNSVLKRDFNPKQMNELLDSTVNKVKKVEESLSTPFAYAKKILLEGQYRYLDSPVDTNQICHFNGRYWKLLSRKELMTIAYQAMSEEDRSAEKNIKTFCSAISDFMMYECANSYENGERFQEKDLRKIQNRIVFRNCVFDVKQQKMLDFDSRLPYYFGVDADYKENDKSTRYYDKLKYDATGGDKESMDMFDYALAYLLLPNRTGKCLIVMANARDSGKSVLGEFIGKLIEGNRTITIDPEHLSGRFAYGRAVNAILYSCLEMSTRKLSIAEVRELKKITGDTMLRSEQKYEREQNVRIRFKLLLATNTGLILDSSVQDEAFFRRVIVLPFIKSTPLDSLISDMPKRLEKEKDYIISKAVRKFGKIIQDDGGIVFPESQISRELKESWANVGHYWDIFIDKCLITTGLEEDAVPKEDIYEAYRFFCEYNRLNDKGMMCDSKHLMDKIKTRYPQVDSRRLRRDSVIHPSGEKTPRPCLVGIKINLDYVNGLKK